MIRLLCNNVDLDLKAGTAFSFEKINPLFAFDNLKCERTQAFPLPDTKTNNALLYYARRPEYNGDGMRTGFYTEMTDGPCVKKGYLYVTEWDGKEYKAVFVTGELFGLLGMRYAGKIAGFFDNSQNILAVGDGGYASAATRNAPLFGNIDYVTNNYPTNDGLATRDDILPSYSLRGVLEAVAAARSFPITFPSEAENYYAIAGELKESPTIGGRFRSIGTGTTNALINTGAMGFQWFTDVSTTTRRMRFYRTQGGYTNYSIREYVAMADLTITFASNLPQYFHLVHFPDGNDIYEIDATQVIDGERVPLRPEAQMGKFYGDYSFAVVLPTTPNAPTRYTTTGEPLAGRSVTIKRGEHFMLFDRRNYVWRWGASEGIQFHGFDFNNQSNAGGFGLNFDYSIQVKTNNPKIGDRVFLRDLLPDVSFLDLCKTLAALTGSMLNYSDAVGLTFETLSDINSWPVFNLDGRSMGKDSTARIFADFARYNAIRFKSADYIKDRDKLETGYQVTNDYLPEDETLYEIPYSEGESFMGNDVYVRQTRDVDDDGKISIKGSGSTIAVAGSNSGTCLDRVHAARNSKIFALAMSGTEVRTKARMALYEFERITAKTIIQYNGARYVWVSANWSKGVASLVLQKI